MQIQAYLIQERELGQIKNITKWNQEGCAVHIEGKRKPYQWYSGCTNDEVYLIASYGVKQIKISDGTKWKMPKN